MYTLAHAMRQCSSEIPQSSLPPIGSAMSVGSMRQCSSEIPQSSHQETHPDGGKKSQETVANVPAHAAKVTEVALNFLLLNQCHNVTLGRYSQGKLNLLLALVNWPMLPLFGAASLRNGCLQADSLTAISKECAWLQSGKYLMSRE